MAPVDLRSYGRLEQQVEQLQLDVHSLKENVQAMRDLMEQGRGGWRTLAWLGGAAGAVGGGLAWIVSHVKVSP